jgi:hypothetical protein
MLTKTQAQFLLEVLKTPGLALPLADREKMRLAIETQDALEEIATRDESSDT